MQAPRLNSSQDFARFWRLRCAVFGDPRMRGEPKAAWEFLYMKTLRAGGGSIGASPEEVAADQGKSARSGYNCLLVLAEHGYLEIIDRPHRNADAVARSGPWKVFLRDALEVAIARPGPKSNGQGALFEVDVEQPADEATIFPAHEGRDASGSSFRPAAAQPPPPAEAATSSENVAPHPPILLHLERNLSKRTSHFENLNFQGEGSRKGNGGSGATTADGRTGTDDRRGERRAIEASRGRREAGGAPIEPQSVGSVLEGLRGLLAGEVQLVEKTQRLKAWILQTAADPDLHPKAAEGLAARVVSGDWPLNELAAVIETTKRHWSATVAGTAKEPIRNRTHYLLGAARRSIAKHDRGLR